MWAQRPRKEGLLPHGLSTPAQLRLGYVEQPLPRAFLLGEGHQAQRRWPHCWGSPNPEWLVSLPGPGLSALHLGAG